MNALNRTALGGAIAVGLMHCSGGSATNTGRSADAGLTGSSSGDHGGPGTEAGPAGESDAGIASDQGSPDAARGDACAPASAAINHRAQTAVCSATPPAVLASTLGASDQCLVDGDCAGQVASGSTLGNGGAGIVCSCRGNTFGQGHSSNFNSCVGGNCRVDSDCGQDGICSPTVSASCGSFFGVQGYYCHTCADRCENDSDCSTNPTGGSAGYCAYDPAVGYWACRYGFCAG